MSEKTGKLTGKTAVVTGCAGGLGSVLAKMMAEEGANVVACDIIEDSLNKQMKPLIDAGLSITPAKLDITVEDDWQRVMKLAVDTYKKVDIVVNNAAIRCEKDILNCSLAEFEKVVKINETGTFLGIKYGALEMDKTGGGSIVNISSIGGIVSGDADGADVGYSASKGGVRTMTKHAAINLASRNIRVNSIHPGGIMTPMLKAVFDATPALWDRVKVSSPLAPHINDPADIAHGVIFLASDDSRTITGVELPIDCGYLAH